MAHTTIYISKETKRLMEKLKIYRINFSGEFKEIVLTLAKQHKVK